MATVTSPDTTANIPANSVLANALGYGTSVTGYNTSVTAASLASQPSLAVASGSLSTLPYGDTTTGASVTLPSNLGSTSSVSNFGGYLKYIVIAGVILITVYFIHAHSFDAVNLLDDIVKKA